MGFNSALKGLNSTCSDWLNAKSTETDPGIESRWGRDFPHLSRPALRPTQPTGSFPGLICGRGVTLTSHPILVPRSKIEKSYTCTLPKGLRGLWKGETYLLRRLVLLQIKSHNTSLTDRETYCLSAFKRTSWWPYLSLIVLTCLCNHTGTQWRIVY
jgi:hypothetical protein